MVTLEIVQLGDIIYFRRIRETIPTPEGNFISKAGKYMRS
jgi:hypothetical protein